MRLLQGHEKALAIRAGAVAGLGVWVATEFLFPLVVCVLALVAKWIASGDRLESLRFVTLSLAVSLLVAVSLERPLADWTVLESERVSALHVTMAAILLAAAWLLGKLPARTAMQRLTVTGGLGLAIAASLQMIFPGFFLGPIRAIQPSVDRFLDMYITELAPTWRSVGAEWPGLALILGAPVLAVLQAIERMWATRKSPFFSSWLVILAWLVSSLVLAILSFRFVPLAEVLVGIPLVAGAERLLARRTPSALRRPLLIAWCLVGYLVLVVASSAFASESAAPTPSNCAFETVEKNLAQTLDTDQAIVLATVPSGPELLWRLRARVVGTPYLNPAGIEFTEDVFRSEDVSFSLSKLDERGIDAIVVCDREPASSGYLGADSFYSRLLARESIPGWSQLLLPPGSDFRIYLRT